MEIEHIMNNLLASIDYDEAAEHSYRDFHVEGLSYLNLLRTSRLTVKLYTFQDVVHNDQGFLVHPHNHGYNFGHRTMVGLVNNHKFHLQSGSDWDLYHFRTPLNGGDGLIKRGRVSLRMYETAVHKPGRAGWYYLDHREIHTLSVDSGYAAALLLQFHDVAPDTPTTMFAPVGEDPNCEDDLYYRLPAWQGRQLVEQYREMLSAQNTA